MLQCLLLLFLLLYLAPSPMLGYIARDATMWVDLRGIEFVFVDSFGECAWLVPPSLALWVVLAQAVVENVAVLL